jgi:hypothetical protein
MLPICFENIVQCNYATIFIKRDLILLGIILLVAALFRSVFGRGRKKKTVLTDKIVETTHPEE